MKSNETKKPKYLIPEKLMDIAHDSKQPRELRAKIFRYNDIANALAKSHWRYGKETVKEWTDNLLANGYELMTVRPGKHSEIDSIVTRAGSFLVSPDKQIVLRIYREIKDYVKLQKELSGYFFN